MVPPVIGRPPSCVCGECKKCLHAAYVREWYRSKTPEQRRVVISGRDLARVHEYDRERAKTEERRVAMGETRKRSNGRYPERSRARWMLKEAVKAGRISRQPCSTCGAPKSHGHHPDYGKPLEVVWLCDHHHKEAHGTLRPDNPKLLARPF